MITKIASIGLITLSLVMQAFPACSAETVLPVRVTIISYQDYLKMQKATAQTQTAAQTASYTETDIQTYSEPPPAFF